MILENEHSSIRRGEIVVSKDRVENIIKIRRLMYKWGITPSEISLSYEGEDEHT